MGGCVWLLVGGLNVMGLSMGWAYMAFVQFHSIPARIGRDRISRSISRTSDALFKADISSLLC